METILSITNLNKRFGSVHAVKNVSLEIQKGNVYGILGPNGSGKSTTLGIVLNVVNKTSGDYSWFGGTMQTHEACLLYTSPSPRDRQKSRMPSSA